MRGIKQALNFVLITPKFAPVQRVVGEAFGQENSRNMLRRASLALTGAGGAAGAYGYMWANDNLGSDALDRIVQVCACLRATHGSRCA